MLPKGGTLLFTGASASIRGRAGFAAFNLSGLADAYWFLHQQPPRAWTFELDMRSKVEPW